MSSTRTGSKQRRNSLTSAGRPANSPTSSTASVSAAALDSQFSPVSSLGKNRTQDFFALERGHVAELDSDGCKENVTVTVRFRPLRFFFFFFFFPKGLVILSICVMVEIVAGLSQES